MVHDRRRGPLLLEVRPNTNLGIDVSGLLDQLVAKYGHPGTSESPYTTGKCYKKSPDYKNCKAGKRLNRGATWVSHEWPVAQDGSTLKLSVVVRQSGEMRSVKVLYRMSDYTRARRKEDF